MIEKKIKFRVIWIKVFVDDKIEQGYCDWEQYRKWWRT